jgi:hypothetical protein
MGGFRTPRQCTMAEPLSRVSERVDASPVLVTHLDRRGLQPLVDRYCPTHGKRVGRSLGWVSVLWLTPRLFEGDHRLNHVVPWAKPRRHTLHECTGQPVYSLDVCHDCLATVLSAVSEETRWSVCEGALNQSTRSVYDLPPACVRLSRTTASDSCHSGPRSGPRLVVTSLHGTLLGRPCRAGVRGSDGGQPQLRDRCLGGAPALGDNLDEAGGMARRQFEAGDRAFGG